MCTFPLMCLLGAWLSGSPHLNVSTAVVSAPPPTTSSVSGGSAATTAKWMALPAAAETFTVGTMKVQRFGDHGRAVILIPGLESGPWSWARVIRHLQGGHRVYAVTLAGFDGVPAPPPDPDAGTLLDRADASLLALIKTRHLDRPVLVGHSIGGTLALRFAGEHAKRLSGVVAVDGLPVFPGMQDLDADQRKAAAKRAKAQMAGLTPDQFKAYASGYMQRVGVIDPDLAAQTVPRLTRSDPAAAAAYMAADLAADYRPGLSRAEVPILEVVPFYEKDYRQSQSSPHKLPDAAGKRAYYQGLLSDAPDARVEVVQPSRHFVMLDQPQKFEKVLDGFLTHLSQEDEP